MCPQLEPKMGKFPIELTKLTQGQRMIFLCLIYSIALTASTVMAYGLRFELSVPVGHRPPFGFWLCFWMLKLLLLACFGQFSSLLSFFSLPDLKRISVALCIATAILAGAWHVGLDSVKGMSRAVILLDGIFSIIAFSL